MPKRTTDEIRKEMAHERRHLKDDLRQLRFELRWLALIPVATALVKRKRLASVKAGLRAMFKIL